MKAKRRLWPCFNIKPEIYQIGVVCYQVLKLSETITEARYRTQLPTHYTIIRQHKAFLYVDIVFGSMAHGLSQQRFTPREDTKHWVDSQITSKEEVFFQKGCQKDGGIKYKVPIFQNNCSIFIKSGGDIGRPVLNCYTNMSTT